MREFGTSEKEAGTVAHALIVYAELLPTGLDRPGANSSSTSLATSTTLGLLTLISTTLIELFGVWRA